MKLRSRLVVAVSAVTLVTLSLAFTAVSIAVNDSQQRQLDAALAAEAREEAHEAADLGHGAALQISDRPGPAANDVGPLTKYGVIYGTDAQVVAATPTFGGRPPALSLVDHPDGVPFNMWFGGEHLRGIFLPIPRHAPARMLLAAPRSDLDGDAAFLLRAGVLVFIVAVAWSVLVATWVVYRLTRDLHAIAEVARKVAAGDLSARVGPRPGDPETAQLASDVDAMIGQLGALINSQQRFIAHAAHELRSPLTTLYGELSHARRRERDATSYENAIDEALESTRKLMTLAEDLLALVRASSAGVDPTEPISTSTLVRAAIAPLRVEIAERALATVVDGDAMVCGHLRDLERMLRNLIENAMRHSPDGSTITVSTRSHDQSVEVDVIDEGAGVPEKDRDRIFEPFYRGNYERAGATPGAGLGLAIAREIARAHGGELALVATQRGSNGARFRVTLPAPAREHSVEQT